METGFHQPIANVRQSMNGSPLVPDDRGIVVVVLIVVLVCRRLFWTRRNEYLPRRLVVGLVVVSGKNDAHCRRSMWKQERKSQMESNRR